MVKILNENGRRLINFATLNEFKITNIFLGSRKFISISARGTKSIIDYVFVNMKLASQIIDTRVYRGIRESLSLKKGIKQHLVADRYNLNKLVDRETRKEYQICFQLWKV